ncbi:hypothetical protein DPMN_046948 [Dreissena polymorpha]|uniref:Uncharacterized protein n=1 Tax=Dreissena polymorpha TaxID=45954 RepID=A0A9D4D8U8_DREPO|nr:hypothetical protein DPMN_046948 [Dreissena polymorpha]
MKKKRKLQKKKKKKTKKKTKKKIKKGSTWNTRYTSNDVILLYSSRNIRDYDILSLLFRRRPHISRMKFGQGILESNHGLLRARTFYTFTLESQSFIDPTSSLRFDGNQHSWIKYMPS